MTRTMVRRRSGLYVPRSAGLNYDAEVLADGPVAYYKLEEASGSSIFADSSGNSGRDLTITGSPTFQDTSLSLDDPSRKGVKFPGTTGVYGSLSGNPSWAQFDNTNGLTFEALVKPSAVNAFQEIITPNNNVRIRLTNSAQMQMIVPATSQLSTGTWPIVANNIYHVAGVYNGTDVRIYVNGMLDTITAKTGTISNTTGLLTLARLSASDSENFNGVLQKVAMYNKPLTNARIAAHARAALADPNATRQPTRLYLNALGTPLISPGFDSLWNVTTSALVRPMSTGALMATSNGAETALSKTNTGQVDRLHRQHVSKQVVVRDHNVSGTMSLVFHVSESNAAADAFIQVVAYLVDRSGGNKRVLYAGQTATSVSSTAGDPNEELATTLTSRILSVSVTPQDAVIGDVLIVELGVRYLTSATTTYTARYQINDNTGASGDLALSSGNTSTTFRGWIEFSDDLFGL